MKPPAVIYPTVFMTGSDGEISTIHPMVQAIVKDTSNEAKDGLQIIVNTDNSLKVSGIISKNKVNPIIEVGMVKGTNSSVKIEEALKAVMTYLKTKYNFSYCNLVGFSAGGGGDLRYLIEDNTSTTATIIRKWVSLDGQFNASTPLSKGETLDEVLKNGPTNQTQYYKFWAANYQKISKNVKVALLAGNYEDKNSTDGVVPWADTFSIYNLLVKNGNPVTRYTFGGANTWHGDVPKNTEAQQFVAKFLFNS